ncbi:MAG: PspC domain-containing protein [Woeseiaceae bacterium]|nr:PspC domain-containing protein [Woeseiaceae bacterium]
MTTTASISDRRFYRSADHAVLGGVCGGLSEYFGFNLKVTRVLAIIGFLMNPPAATVAYFAVVFLVPSRSREARQPKVDEEFRKALRSSPGQTLGDVRSRFKSLDRRLARLEKYVTSSRYQLDREFKELER